MFVLLFFQQILKKPQLLKQPKFDKIYFQPKILVAGGCSGNCNETEIGIQSAELYNPKTNEWKQVLLTKTN